jgi:hypothetical protein
MPKGLFWTYLIYQPMLSRIDFRMDELELGFSFANPILSLNFAAF